MSIAISRDWQDLEMEDPHEAWFSFAERMNREKAGHEKCAAKLRKDAADALEQALEHERIAEEFGHLLEALKSAPVTHPCDSGSGPQGGDNLLAPGEAPQSGGASRIAHPIPESPNDLL